MRIINEMLIYFIYCENNVIISCIKNNCIQIIDERLHYRVFCPHARQNWRLWDLSFRFPLRRNWNFLLEIICDNFFITCERENSEYIDCSIKYFSSLAFFPLSRLVSETSIIFLFSASLFSAFSPERLEKIFIPTYP